MHISQFLSQIDKGYEMAKVRGPGKANLRHAISLHGGVVSEIASHFEVTRTTVYNWLDHYDLRDEIHKSRTQMRDVAEDVMYQVLISDPRSAEDPDKALDRQIGVAKFTLQNTKTDGTFISISDEVLRLLPRIGMTIEDASQIFEDMVREAARQKATA